MSFPRPENFLESVAQLATDAASIVAGVKDQIRGEAKRAVNRVVAELDLVPRADFEQLEAMVRKQGDELAALKAGKVKPAAKPNATAKVKAPGKKAIKAPATKKATKPKKKDA